MSDTPIVNALDERAMILEGAELVDGAHAGSFDMVAVGETAAVFGTIEDGADDEHGEPFERLDEEAWTDRDD